jgi:hypothetical protein
MRPSDFKIGQTLFIKYYNRPKLFGHKIVKVGRKWLTLDNNEKIDLETLQMDGDYLNKAYVTEAEYAQEHALSDAWSQFHAQISRAYSMPKGVSITDIEAARTILKLGSTT